ncbi:MAG: hypothetical protein AB1331_07040 [Bacillota bacterium]
MRPKHWMILCIVLAGLAVIYMGTRPNLAVASQMLLELSGLNRANITGITYFELVHGGREPTQQRVVDSAKFRLFMEELKKARWAGAPPQRITHEISVSLDWGDSIHFSYDKSSNILSSYGLNLRVSQGFEALFEGGGGQ